MFSLFPQILEHSFVTASAIPLPTKTARRGQTPGRAGSGQRAGSKEMQPSGDVQWTVEAGQVALSGSLLGCLVLQQWLNMPAASPLHQKGLLLVLLVPPSRKLQGCAVRVCAHATAGVSPTECLEDKCGCCHAVFFCMCHTVSDLLSMTCLAGSASLLFGLPT